MALFEPEFGLVFWMLVVFLIVFGILAKYGWPVIIKSIEERAEFIDNGVKYSQQAMKEKIEAEAKAQLLLADAHKQQLEILQEAEQLKQAIVAGARTVAVGEAQKVINAAKLSVEQAQKEAELQVRKRVGVLSLQIAEKVIREKLGNDEAQAEMIDKFLDEVGGLKN